MTSLQAIEKIGNDAVQELRLQKLCNGHPFMINCNELEPSQCYLEYPHGNILLVFLKKGARDFTAIRTLSSAEAKRLRDRYRLPNFQP
jgi:hypothetical protein